MKEQSSVATIVEALGLAPNGELDAIVGGGGKSSLMFELAERLPGRGVMTTTTRIFSQQMSGALECCTLADADWRARLDAFESALLVVGRVEGERAVGVAPELPAELLAHPKVTGIATFVGQGPPRFYLPVDPEMAYPSYGQVVVNVGSLDEVGEVMDHIGPWLRENTPQAVARVRRYGVGSWND